MSPEQQPIDFGTHIRDARLRKGVSLREIADVTRISVSVLESLERNDVSKLPGGIFSRSFVRAYAREVDLDPDGTVDRFIEQFPHDSITVGHTSSSATWEDLQNAESRRQRMASLFKLAGAAAIAIAAVIYVAMHLDGLRLARLSEPLTRVAAAWRGSPAPALVAPAVAPAAVHLSIELAGVRASTVSVTADGRSDSFILMAGEHREYRDVADVVLVMSDAAALDVTIDGERARQFGEAGDVVTVHLTGDNYRDYLPARLP